MLFLIFGFATFVVSYVARIIIITIALKGVPADHRAAVLEGLSKCFRSFRRGRGS